MTVSATNTETIRDAIATVLETALTGTGNVLQKFYGYRTTDFGQETPAMVMFTRSNEAEERTAGELATQTMKFFLVSFIPYVAKGFTAITSEDKLNEVYKDTVDTILNNKAGTSPVPYEIFLDGEAPVVLDKLGGIDYLVQTIPISVRVFETS